MFIMSYIGDHVWLITSRQTEPDLLIGGQQFVFYHSEFLEKEQCLVQFINVWMEYPIHKAYTR